MEAPPAAEPAMAPDDSHVEDIPPDQPPDPTIVVPPREQPAPPSAEQQLVANALVARLQQARLSMMVSLGLKTQAANAAAVAETGVVETRSGLEKARQVEVEALAALGRQRVRVRRWAVEAYSGGSLRRVAFVLDSNDINELPRRLGLARGVFDSFQDSVSEQEAALDAAARRRGELEDGLSAAEERLAAARKVAADAVAQLARRRQEVAALGVGRAVSIGGVAFPIAGPSRYIDTFGAPRMTGTPFAHFHEGVDIFASPGAPVVAFERGVVVRLGTDVLGGTKLWLVGQSGTRYYYAHLQGYAPGLVEGQLVEVGQTLAFVGNTGNAVTTPHHLHFEIHPGGGPAINPYPLILQIEQAARLGARAVAGSAAPRRAGTVLGGG